MKTIKLSTVILTVVFASAAWAGVLYPPGYPEAGSGMCNMDELYDYLLFGVYPESQTSFREPETYPGPTMKTIQEILEDAANQFNQADAAPGHVLEGVSYFSTNAAAWGPRQGTLTRKSLSGDSTMMETGYYAGTDLTSVDPDLNSGNIRNSIAIFGVQGASAKVLSPDSTSLEAGFYEATTLSAVDTDLTPSKIKGGVNIFGVQGTHCCPGTATTADVLTGTTFSSAAAGNNVNGTMPDREGDNASTAQAYDPVNILLTFTPLDGYYDGDDRVTATEEQVRALDPDNNIVAENIRGGVNIFGTDGGLIVRNSVTGTDGQLTIPLPDGIYESKSAIAQDAKLIPDNIKPGMTIFGVTGGVTCICDPASLEKGRWCVNGDTNEDGDWEDGDGTVTDMTNCVIWLRDACIGAYNWWEAHGKAAEVKQGNPASLADGSNYNDWRLPTYDELHSLGMDANYIRSGDQEPFSGVQETFYWSSTTDDYTHDDAQYAWTASLSFTFFFGLYPKTTSFSVWPVRGGQ